MEILVFFFADLTAPAAISLALCGWASCASVLYLTHDAALVDFDPRPAVSRAVRSEAVYPLLREWDIARHASREALRDAAALLLLLTTTPKGQLR